MVQEIAIKYCYTEIAIIALERTIVLESKAITYN